MYSTGFIQTITRVGAYILLENKLTLPTNVLFSTPAVFTVDICSFSWNLSYDVPVVDQIIIGFSHIRPQTHCLAVTVCFPLLVASTFYTSLPLAACLISTAMAKYELLSLCSSLTPPWCSRLCFPSTFSYFMVHICCLALLLLCLMTLSALVWLLLLSIILSLCHALYPFPPSFFAFAVLCCSMSSFPSRKRHQSSKSFI